MLIPSQQPASWQQSPSLSRGMNANSQPTIRGKVGRGKSIKRDEC